jgi:hypothetical protein
MDGARRCAAAPTEFVWKYRSVGAAVVMPSYRSLAVLLFFGASIARAQTFVAGQVVDRAKRVTLAHVAVELLGVRDTTVLDTATTEADGTFSLKAPAGGWYRVRLTAPGAVAHVSDSVVVADGEYAAREFAINPIPKPYFEFQVDRPARPTGGSGGPIYPKTLRSQGVSGCVIAQFVIEADGRVNPATLEVLRASHIEFVQAVRESLPTMHFAPARLGGRPVRQIAQQPFMFRIETRVTTVGHAYGVVPADRPLRPGQLPDGTISSSSSSFAEPPSPMPPVCTSSPR